MVVVMTAVTVVPWAANSSRQRAKNVRLLVDLVALFLGLVDEFVPPPWHRPEASNTPALTKVQ